MRTQLLQHKLARYLAGNANPAEIRQVQTWLSCTSSEVFFSEKEKQLLEKEIRKEIHDLTGSLPDAPTLKSFFFNGL